MHCSRFYLKVLPPMTMGDCRTINRYTQVIASSPSTMREVGLKASVMSVTVHTTMR